MDEHQVAHHGDVAAAGSQVQGGALVVVPIIYLHIIATQHEVHLRVTICHHQASVARNKQVYVTAQAWPA